MLLIIRGSAPMVSCSSRTEGMARGLRLLRRVSRTDFGYDLRAWHEHLVETDAGGYKSSGRHRAYSEQIETALSDPDWLAAAKEAETANLCEKLSACDRQHQDAKDGAEREWSGQPRVCPKCQTEFSSIQDKGQCPECRHMFYASHLDGE